MGYLLFVDVVYLKNLREKHNDLPFLPGKVKRNKVIKLTCETTDKNNYSLSTFALKQALNHGLILKEVHSVTRGLVKTLHWYEYTIKNKSKQLMNLKKIFTNYGITVYMVRLWKMLENIEILD